MSNNIRYLWLDGAVRKCKTRNTPCVILLIDRLTLGETIENRKWIRCYDRLFFTKEDASKHGFICALKRGK